MSDNILTVAIGDIHGCYNELLQLIKNIQYATLGSKTQFVFLGDYIDRGPDSKKVIDYLIDLDNRGIGAEIEYVFLRGNHDNMAIGHGMTYAQSTPDGYSNWMSNGGKTTLDSYPDQKMTDEHKLWIAKTSLFYKDDMRTYVHAGIVRDYPVEEQTEFNLTWIRDEFLHDTRSDQGYIVHGHTPGYDVDLQPNRCNLDTGCVYGLRYGITGGVISAGLFNNQKEEPFMIINSNGVYQKND